MSDFKITISPELQLLADAQGWDLQSLIEEGATDKLIEWFRCGEEITEYDIKRWFKIEMIPPSLSLKIPEIVFHRNG